MKKLSIITICCMFALAGIAQPPNVPADKGASFGASFNAKNPLTVEQMTTALHQKADKKMDVILKGVVVDVCTREGCWLKVKSPSGNMMVKMKDHAFLVPLAINGKEVVIKGVAEQKVTSIETLKHYAEDAGKSPEEIEKITEPKTEIVINADGIMVI